MLNIRKMVVEDIASAVKLTDTRNWELTTEDFEFMMEMEPEGCFVILDDSKFIGLTIAVTFANLGWIGNVIVDRDYRRRGIGSLLIKHSINYFLSRDVTTIGLYSYMDVLSFYEKLGFKLDETFIYLSGSGVQLNKVTTVKRMEDEDFKTAVNLDRYCIGVSREKLLKGIFAVSKELCYVTYKDNTLIGFVMAAKSSKNVEIGPLICDSSSEDKAIDLVKAILRKFIGFNVHIGIPEKQFKMLSALRGLGFRDNFKVVRMYYGNVPPDKGCIFAMESLERG